MPIIRRNNSICATVGTHSVWMTVWYAGAYLVCRSIRSCIPNSHPHRVENTKRRINTVISPDDGHIVARNMYRKEINILRKTVQNVGFIYRIILLGLLRCVSETVEVTELRKYFPRGLHVGQPCPTHAVRSRHSSVRTVIALRLGRPRVHGSRP